MKKQCLIAVLAIFSMSQLQGQGPISFGATGGLFLGNADVSIAGVNIGSISDDIGILDGGGFYLGFLANIDVIGKLHVQPELLYANIGGESVIIVPIMAKYYVADAFNIQAGPQFDFILDVPAIVDDLINSLGVSLGIGVGYDLGDKFALQAKYTFGLNDRVDVPSINIGGIQLDSASVTTNILQAGVVYKFN